MSTEETKSIKEKQLDESEPEETEEVIEEVLEAVPPQHRKTIERMMVSSFRMQSISPEAKMMEKVTEQHIDKFLDTSKETMEKEYQEKAHRKIYTAVLAIFGMAFLLAVILILRDNPDVMEKVIYTVGGVIVGALGGYGFGKSRDE